MMNSAKAFQPFEGYHGLTYYKTNVRFLCSNCLYEWEAQAEWVRGQWECLVENSDICPACGTVGEVIDF